MKYIKFPCYNDAEFFPLHLKEKHIDKVRIISHNQRPKMTIVNQTMKSSIMPIVF